MDTRALWQKAGRVDPISARWYLIAFHRRFALPTACLVLALVGIPLGLSSKKSGKSGGFVLTILLVFVYYVISLVGVSLARQGKVSPWFGAWLADFVFLALAIFLLLRAEKRPFELASFRGVWKRDAIRRRQPSPSRGRRENAFERASTRRRVFSASFPTLLDDYVLRDFFLYLAMILSTFLVLVIVFTLFELLGDILRNQVPATGGRGIPAQRRALSALQRGSPGHAAGRAGHLWPDAALQRNHRHQGHGNQHLPHRHSGDRSAAVLAAGLFFADQFYLPHTNKRQEALHNQIKGKPAQTYLRPDRKWIFGQNNDIYYYQFFDPDRDQFGNLTVFQARSCKLRHHAPHPRRPRPLGRQSESLGLRTRMGPLPQGLGHRQLPSLRRRHLPRLAGNAVVFQKGSETVHRDELRRVAPLYPRLAAKRIRRGAPYACNCTRSCRILSSL